jgi:hypothetical protein
VLANHVGGGANRHAAADQATHREAAAKLVEREREHGLDLGRVRLEPEVPADHADERVDLVVGDEGADRRQRPDDIDLARRQPDLLVGLAKRRLDQRLAGMVAPTARERDLAGVTAEVVAALGEHEAGSLGVSEHGHEDRGLGSPVGVDRLRFGGGEENGAQLLDRIVAGGAPRH